jgi:hypothetical protein
MGENMWVEFSADITRVFFTTTEAQLLFLDDAIFRPTPMPLPVMSSLKKSIMLTALTVELR